MDGITRFRISPITTQARVLPMRGIFGVIEGPHTVVKNVTLTDVDIDLTPPYSSPDGFYVGAIAGDARKGAMIVNCHSSGTVGGHLYVGGIVGSLQSGAIVDGSSSSVDVGKNLLRQIRGGLVGGAEDGTMITNSYTTGDVQAFSNVGGLAGHCVECFIAKSYAAGAVTGQGSGVGGLVGQVPSTIRTRVFRSFAIGTVAGDDAGGNVGGLLGTDVAGVAVDSYRYSGAGNCTNASGSCNSQGGAEATLADLYDTSAHAVYSGWEIGSLWRDQSAGGATPTLEPTELDLDVWGSCSSHTGGGSFAGGNGSALNPYLICTPDQLELLANDANPYHTGYYFQLMTDIAMGGAPSTHYPIGANGENHFRGMFNGNGYEIRNFTFNNGTGDAALFGDLDAGGIKRLAVTDADIDASGAGAILILNVNLGVLADSYTTGTVDGPNVSGVASQTQAAAHVENLYSSATVTGSWSAGGVIRDAGADLLNSFFDGSIPSTAGGGGYGFVDNNGAGDTSTSYYNTASCGGCTNNGATGVGTAGYFHSEGNSPMSSWDDEFIWSFSGSAHPTLRKD